MPQTPEVRATTKRGRNVCFRGTYLYSPHDHNEIKQRYQVKTPLIRTSALYSMATSMREQGMRVLGHGSDASDQLVEQARGRQSIGQSPDHQPSTINNQTIDNPDSNRFVCFLLLLT